MGMKICVAPPTRSGCFSGAHISTLLRSSGLALATLVCAWASGVVHAQTYTVSDVSAPGANPSFATGVYSIAIEPNTVRDEAGNFMPAGTVGTFTVALELKPVFSLSPTNYPIMNVPMDFTLTAKSSFPYAAADVFSATIDWGDGSALQNVSGATGTAIPHISLGATPGTLSLDWSVPDCQWRFTVQFTDSLNNPNWQPVAPASQWPSVNTHFMITHDPLLKQGFFRVVASSP